MKKFLLALLTIIPISSGVISIVVGSQVVRNNITYVNKTIYLDNKKQKLVENQDSFVVNGNYYDTTHRIYMSSNKDKTLPEQDNRDDYIIGKGKKDKWYNKLFSALSLDITKYAANKTEFLNRYNSVNINYSYMDNFWNGLQGWTNLYQKKPSILPGIYILNLKANDEKNEVFQDTDKKHKSNEKVRFILNSSWNGNILNLNWELGVWYHWALGSIFNHAALASFTNDQYTFLKMPRDNNKLSAEIKNSTIVKSSSFTLANESKVSGLSSVDSELKNKSKQKDINNSLFKFIPMIVQTYVGGKIVHVSNGTWFFTLAVVMTWYSDSWVALDSNLILSSGLDINRSLSINTIGSIYSMTYKSISGVDYGNYEPLDPRFIGMKLFGTIIVPYIYLA